MGRLCDPNFGLEIRCRLGARRCVLDRLVLEILGAILEVLGRHWDSFWRSWSAIGGHFVGLGLTLGGSRGTLGHLRRAVASKNRWCLLASPHFNRFWRPKADQKAPKMELKSVKNGLKIRSTFLFDFS